MSSAFIKLLPVAAMLTIGGVAQATTRATPDVPSVTVRFGDLNLNSVDGVEQLHARLRGASRKVCSSLDSRVLGLREQYEDCVSDALRRSVEDVGNEKLTTYHRWGRRALVASNG